MKFMLIIILTMGVSNDPSVEPKSVEMRIPQENQKECLKSAKTLKFSLPNILSVDTRCEPKRINEEPEIRGVNT